MNTAGGNPTIDAVILCGGALDEVFLEYSDAPSKGLIPLNGRPMVEYVIDAVRAVSRVGRIVLAANPDTISDSLRKKVDAVAPEGESMLKSLSSAVGALDPLPDYLFILPCDLPLVTTASLDDFLDQILTTPIDISYAYLSKQDSEAAYPDVKHTYVTLREGTFCGSGLFMMRPGMVASCESLFGKLTENRKNPVGIATMLGPMLIIKFLMKQLSVAEAEQKLAQLMGNCRAKAVRTRYAEAAFNVDKLNELLVAKRILENQPAVEV